MNWTDLLTRWSYAACDTPDLAVKLPPDVRASRWLGFDGATAAQIAAAEERLGAPLPQSYGDFLRVSNGWRHLGIFIDRLWSVEQVDWYATRHQDLIDAWLQGESLGAKGGVSISDEAYDVYGPDQDPISMRSQYLQTALEVSDGASGDGVLLLNPNVLTETGEWEAWFHATWLPGARRYRSFADLMIGEYDLFIHLIYHR